MKAGGVSRFRRYGSLKLLWRQSRLTRLPRDSTNTKKLRYEKMEEDHDVTRVRRGRFTDRVGKKLLDIHEGKGEGGLGSQAPLFGSTPAQLTSSLGRLDYAEANKNEGKKRVEKETKTRRRERGMREKRPLYVAFGNVGLRSMGWCYRVFSRWELAGKGRSTWREGTFTEGGGM